MRWWKIIFLKKLLRGVFFFVRYVFCYIVQSIKNRFEDYKQQKIKEYFISQYLVRFIDRYTKAEEPHIIIIKNYSIKGE